MNDSANVNDDELESLVGQAADEFTDRVNRGESVEVEEYAQRYPQIADILRQMLPSLDLLGKPGAARDESARGLMSGGSQPTYLGEFRVLREIGRGGMGIVYEAEQKSLGRRVALKVLPTHRLMDPLYLKRFQREAQAAARLHHTNIVPVFGVGEDNGVHFYAMQFIAGYGLDRVIKELKHGQQSSRAQDSKDDTSESMLTMHSACGIVQGLCTGQFLDVKNSSGPVRGRQDRSTSVDMSFPQYCRSVAHIGIQVADALAYAHTQGVLHRDIKPSNLLLDAAGTVWITDFGLAKADNAENLTHTGDLVGTLRYAAPERLAGQADARSDVFSLGLTLYELLALRAAYDEKTEGRLVQQVSAAAPAPLHKLDRRIPSNLRTIVQKAIAKEPHRRYATAAELGHDLQRFLEDRPILARRTSHVELIWRWCRRNPVVAALISVIAIMTLTIAVGSSLSARRLRAGLDRAEQAEDSANRRLYDSLLAQAHASRWSGQAGQRFNSLRAIGQAVPLVEELGLGPEAFMALRNETIACLALTDVTPVQTWEPSPPDTGHEIFFDERLEYCARSDRQGNIGIWRTGESAASAQLASLGREPDSIVVSPGARYIAIGLREPRSPKPTFHLAIWDREGGNEAIRLPYPVARRVMAFHPQGNQFVVGQNDGSIVWHELPGCRELRRLNGGDEPLSIALDHKARHFATSHDDEPLSIALDAKARHFATSHNDNHVCIRNADSGALIRKLEMPAHINCLAWHPDGDLLAVACHDSHIYIWNVPSGRNQAILTTVQSSAVRMGFSKTGDLLMNWSWDGGVRLHNPWTGQQLLKHAGVGGYLSSDGHSLVSRQGSKLTLWDVAPGTEYQTLPNPPAPSGEPLNYLAPCLSPNRRWLIVGGRDGMRIWDLHAGQQVLYVPLGQVSSPLGQVRCVFAPTDKEFFTFGSAGLQRWPFAFDSAVLKIGPPELLKEAPSEVRTVSLDAQARMLAVRDPSSIMLWDRAQPGAKPLVLNDRGVGQVLSPDGAWIANTPWNTDMPGIKIWDTRTGACAKELLPDVRVANVAFSPNSEWLVTRTGLDYKFWKAGSWQLEATIPREAEGDNPGPIAWCPTGALVAITRSARQIQLLEAGSNRPLATLEAPNSDAVSWIGFSADGSHLIVVTSSPGCIRTWDLRVIRAQLATLGLDWDLPPYPPTKHHDLTPVRVEVDLGELAPKASKNTSP